LGRKGSLKDEVRAWHKSSGNNGVERSEAATGPREIIHRAGCHSSRMAADLFKAGQLTVSLSCTGNHPQPFSTPEALI